MRNAALAQMVMMAAFSLPRVRAESALVVTPPQPHPPEPQRPARRPGENRQQYRARIFKETPHD
jgi:hypothetical protein